MKWKHYFHCLLVVIGIWIAGCSSDKTKVDTIVETPQATLSKPVEIIDNGKLLFEEKCAICHGSDGTAGIANATNLRTTQADSVLIIQTIANGRNAMPAFKDQLTPEEVTQLDKYVRMLRK